MESLDKKGWEDMGKISVRLAAVTDAEGLAVLNLAFNGVTRTPQAVRDCLTTVSQSGLDGEIVAVALAQREIVGFACARSYRSFCYQEPSGEITEMFVKEDHRRKGVAKKLLGFLEEQLVQLGVREVRILTGADNLPAQAAYASCGYVIEDEIVLEKVIADNAGS